MARLPLVVHERLGVWARQLRPRVAGWPVRLVESRSVASLLATASQSACPLVLFDLANRPVTALAELEQLMQAAPGALVLVLAPSPLPELTTLARELGAASVLPGTPPPPAVVSLLARWVPLAVRRAEAEGWAAAQDEPEPAHETDPWHAAEAARLAGATRAGEPVGTRLDPIPRAPKV